MIDFRATFAAMVEKAKLVLVLASGASLVYTAVLVGGNVRKGVPDPILQLVWALFLAAPLGFWFLAMFFAVRVLWPMYFPGRLGDPSALDAWWRKAVIPPKDGYLRLAFEFFLTGFVFLAVVLVSLLPD